MRGSPTFALLGLVVAALGSAAVNFSSPWPARLPLHLGLWIAAGAVWALSLLLLHRLRRWRSDRVVLVVFALLLRLPCWLAPPAHSVRVLA